MIDDVRLIDFLAGEPIESLEKRIQYQARLQTHRNATPASIARHGEMIALLEAVIERRKSDPRHGVRMLEETRGPRSGGRAGMIRNPRSTARNSPLHAVPTEREAMIQKLGEAIAGLERVRAQYLDAPTDA